MDQINNGGKKTEGAIMAKIKSGQVRLRSKYLFVAEKLGLGGSFFLSLILAILFFNLILFYMREMDSLEYLSFGAGGFLAFLESFPYFLVITFILFLFLAGYLVTKSDVSYKKPFAYLALGLIVFIMIAGSFLAYSDINSKMVEESIYGSRKESAFIRPFFAREMGMRDHRIAGLISETGDSYLLIRTPYGTQRINLTEAESAQNLRFEPGQFVIAIGNNSESEFLAQEIRIIGQDEMPMIRRGIDRHFNQPGLEPFIDSRPHMPFFPGGDKRGFEGHPQSYRIFPRRML